MFYIKYDIQLSWISTNKYLIICCSRSILINISFLIVAVEGSTSHHFQSCRLRLFNEHVVEGNSLTQNRGSTLIPIKLHNCSTLCGYFTCNNGWITSNTFKIWCRYFYQWSKRTNQWMFLNKKMRVYKTMNIWSNTLLLFFTSLMLYKMMIEKSYATHIYCYILLHTFYLRLIANTVYYFGNYVCCDTELKVGSCCVVMFSCFQICSFI